MSALRRSLGSTACCVVALSLGLAGLRAVRAQSPTPTPKKIKASATPEKHASPASKTLPTKKKKLAKASPSASAKPEKTPTVRRSQQKPTPRRKSKSPGQAKETPTPRKAASVAEKSAPHSPSPAAAAAITPEATLSPTPNAIQPFDASGLPQVNVEKSGFLGEQGLEPPPTPPPARRHWWFWSRPEANYRYLSRSVREQIDRAPVLRRRWQFIVVHNSGTRQGSARIFDYYHRNVRHMQNGLAYHFVIGNGTSTGDGEIEVGDRWRRQINGGHVHSDYLNSIALGICLVGDFNRGQPTPRQLEATEELIGYLRKRCGRVEGHDVVVRPHRDVNPPQWATDCPGDDFPYTWFRRFQQ